MKHTKQLFVFISAILFSCVALMSQKLQGENYESKNFDYEVLSLSSAMIDHLVFIPEEQLNFITNEKGNWAPIDYTTLCDYLNNFGKNSKICPGGSGINVIKGLAHLGNRCAVIGKIGSDDMGDYFLEQLNKKGIISLLERGSLPTGQAICFITPDGQRTFRSYPGASHVQSDLKFQPFLFEKIKLFHIEGYQLMDPGLVLRALKIAKQHNITTSIDLANAELIRIHKSFIIEILEKYIDIVLCNQDEAAELTGQPPKEANAMLAEMCSISVVTMGEKGCWTHSKEGQFFTPAFTVEPIDTTGAGDYFASGFLHGFLNGNPLQECAEKGSLVASYVVAEVGTELNEEIWGEIHRYLGDE